MATTDESDVETQPAEGIVARVGSTVYRVVEESIVPDARRRSLTPLAAVLVAGAVIALVDPPWAVLGVLAVVLLAYWLGARG